MPSDEQRLEASLQAAWDADTAAVYADLLTDRGDPRGELIAIDLAITRGFSRQLDERRRERLFAWLGGDTIGGCRLHPRQFRYGLLDEFDVQGDAKHSQITVLQALLDSPAGNYVRGLRLSGGHTELSQCINALAARGMPWLRRLAITQHRSHPIANARFAKLFSATPNLVELAVQGSGLLVSPGHPNVTTLRVVGGDALVIGASPMSHVTTLDLAFDDTQAWRATAPEEHVKLAPLINPRTFPELRTLDLSRNDVRRRVQSPPSDSVYLFLDAVERVERLAKIRVPAIHTDETAAQVIALLERCPMLEVEIARMYVARPELVHPRLRVPPPYPWPVPGILHGRDALSIAIPGVRYGEDLALSSIASDLEDQFERMPPHAQAAWLALWDFLDGLDWEDDQGRAIELPFDAQTLLVALDAIDSNGRCDNVAAMIRNAKLAEGTPATIKRYWGW